jgi:parvulin-like peptidyl-prolyl isomerase
MSSRTARFWTRRSSRRRPALRHRPVRWSLALMAVGGALAGCRSSGSDRPASGGPEHEAARTVSRTSTPPDAGAAAAGVILTVNQESVTADQILSRAREEIQDKAKSMPPDAFRAWLDRRAAELITDAVAEMLLYQRAKAKLPADSDSRVDGFVDAEVRRVVATRYDGVQLRYEKDLEARGQTLEEVRQSMRRELVIAGFLETEIKPRIGEPTRAELVAAFERVADSLRRPERRRMSLIEVRITPAPSDRGDTGGQNAPDDARARAETRIRNAEAELRAGQRFADVAGRYSDGARAAEGGAWGWISRGSVREKYEPAVECLYRLGEGEVSGVIESGDALFLVRCDAIEPAMEPSFATAQLRLRDELIRQKSNELTGQLVNELRRDASIEPANLDELHAAIMQKALALAAVPSP